VNEATPEFEAVSSDAARMGESIVSVSASAESAFRQIGVSVSAMSSDVVGASENAVSSLEQISVAAITMSATVAGQPVTIQAEDLASPEISWVAEEAARVKAEVEGSPITITFAPVEVPPLPPVDTSPIQESFNQVGMSATAMGTNVRAAGSSFTEMGTYAEATEVKLTTVARAISSVGMMGTGLITLASDFGMVDKETAKYMRTITAVIMVVSAFARMKAYLTLVTTGQTAAVAIEGTTTTATSGALGISAIAHKVYAAACSLATAAQSALNISHATFLALTGVGIGVIIAAAAAVAIFASQMRSATESVKEYNATAAETPTRTRGIQRSGEESMYRRGVE
jgi:hypothetical protein